MKSICRAGVWFAAALLIQAGLAAGEAAAQTRTREVPKFEVDPNWPQLPSKWVWGQVSSVSIDEHQHAWVLQRPGTIRTDQKGKAAPPLIEFDENGKFVQAWGGPGAGYDWPEIGTSRVVAARCRSRVL